jgi:aspartate/methionine/tyrosine aminotransferase
VRVGIFLPVQLASIAALTGPQDSVADRTPRTSGARARRRRCSASRAARAPIYVWLRLPDGLTAERLLVEHRVAVAPGEGFGPSGAGCARISLACPTTSRGGLARLVRALEQVLRMKIAIVVPFSWSYWGGVSSTRSIRRRR